MNISSYQSENYWNDIDKRLESLKKNGHVKLPSIKDLNIDSIAEEINNEMNGATFSELGKSHENFLKDLEVDKNLTPRLFKIAREEYGYKGEVSNQYHIARRVEPGNSKEMYRAHFDSHLFTIVFPLKIPRSTNDGSAGELIYFPNARKSPKNELKNIIDKVYFKRFASKDGMEKFALNNKQYTEDFNDYSPLLFIGNTTLHTNKQVSLDCTSYRLTLLAHFFDSSSKFGVGNIMRIVRGR